MAIEMLVTWMSTVLRGALAPVRDDRGQTMAEDGLILAGIAVVVMAAIVVLGPAIAQIFTDVANSL